MTVNIMVPVRLPHWYKSSCFRWTYHMTYWTITWRVIGLRPS